MAAKKRSEEQVVRIAPLGELRAYTISEHELELFEQGGATSDLLTLGLCLLSAALTVFATILSTTLPDSRFTLFFCALLIFSISGVVCTFMGWRLRKGIRELAAGVRSRMPDLPIIRQVGAIEDSPGGALLQAQATQRSAQAGNTSERPGGRATIPPPDSANPSPPPS